MSVMKACPNPNDTGDGLDHTITVEVVDAPETEVTP